MSLMAEIGSVFSAARPYRLQKELRLDPATKKRMAGGISLPPHIEHFIPVKCLQLSALYTSCVVIGVVRIKLPAVNIRSIGNLGRPCFRRCLHGNDKLCAAIFGQTSYAPDFRVDIGMLCLSPFELSSARSLLGYGDGLNGHHPCSCIRLISVSSCCEIDLSILK